MRVFRHNMPVLDIIMSKAGILCLIHTFCVNDDTIMCKCDIFVGHAYKYVTSVHKNVCMYTLLCHWHIIMCTIGLTDTIMSKTA